MSTKAPDRALEEQQTNSVLRLQWITLGWMTVEFCVAMVAGIRARSVALTAFGADSAIELLSAAIVLRRFKIGATAEASAARMSAVLLYALAGYRYCQLELVTARLAA